MNPFYQPAQNPISQMIGQIQNNPYGFLARSKFNVPNNVGSSSGDIIQHLLTTGQITQEQLNWAVQRAREIQP